MADGMMCPHCGALVDLDSETRLVAYHDCPLPTRQVCPGSGQNPRYAYSDRRPLWNGEQNPHFGEYRHPLRSIDDLLSDAEWIAFAEGCGFADDNCPRCGLPRCEWNLGIGTQHKVHFDGKVQS